MGTKSMNKAWCCKGIRQIYFISKIIFYQVFTQISTLSSPKLAYSLCYRLSIPQSTTVQIRWKVLSPLWSKVNCDCVVQSRQVGLCAPPGHTGTQAPFTCCPVSLHIALIQKVEASSLESYLHSFTWIEGKKLLFKEVTKMFLTWPTERIKLGGLCPVESPKGLVTWGKRYQAVWGN